jgi:hypothetical protein
MKPTAFRAFTRAAPLALIALVALQLVACAGYAPTGLAPGVSPADAQRLMGAPTGEHRLADGKRRIEYARGPAGKHTYMLDFDAQDRLAATEQVLTEEHFAKIEPGQMRDEVLRQLGRPSNVQWIAYQRRHIWSYRYDAVFCQWFQVSLDTQGRVVETGYGPDPSCDVNDRDL